MGSQFPRFVSSLHCSYLALPSFLRHLPHSLDRDADSGLRNSLLSCRSPTELLILLPFLLSDCCDSKGQEVCISTTAWRAKAMPTLPRVLPSFIPLSWPAQLFLGCVRVEEISSDVLFEQGLVHIPQWDSESNHPRPQVSSAPTALEECASSLPGVGCLLWMLCLTSCRLTSWGQGHLLFVW